MSSIDATDIRLVGPEDDDRLSRFIHRLLTRNGFPFLLVSWEIDLAGGFKRVKFEDADVSLKFAREWTETAATA